MSAALINQMYRNVEMASEHLIVAINKACKTTMSSAAAINYVNLAKMLALEIIKIENGGEV